MNAASATTTAISQGLNFRPPNFLIDGESSGTHCRYTRAGCAGNTVYMALQGFTGRINMDFRALSNSHAPQLSLFEIGGDPDFIERHHGEQLLSRLNV
jgi:hypothetical protein